MLYYKESLSSVNFGSRGATLMISSGRYLYHLQDIAEIEAMPQPVSAIQQMRLDQMKAEAAEFATANPDEAARIQARAKELAGN
jgi:hypothetical protein